MKNFISIYFRIIFTSYFFLVLYIMIRKTKNAFSLLLQREMRCKNMMEMLIFFVLFILNFLSWHLIMRKICMQHLELLLWKSTLMDFCNYISTYTKSPIWKSVNSRTTVGGDWAFGFRFARSWMELEFKTVKQDLLAHCIWTESFHTFLC